MVCRFVQKSLLDEKLVDQNVIVFNKPGAGGTTGWNYLRGKEGQGEYLAATSTLIMLNNLLGKSCISYRDLTPVAALQTEWISVAVGADSPWKTIRELFGDLKRNPAVISVAVGPTLGNNDHMMFLELAQKFAVDPYDVNFIPYPGVGGEIVPALMADRVQVTAIGLAEVLEYHKKGDLRVIGVSSDKRLDFLPDVATFKEQGVDLVFPHWRGLVGPPGLSEDQLKYWDDVLSKMVQSKTWNTLLAEPGWTNFYQNSAEHKAFLMKSTVEFDRLLTRVGLK